MSCFNVAGGYYLVGCFDIHCISSFLLLRKKYLRDRTRFHRTVSFLSIFCCLLSAICYSVICCPLLYFAGAHTPGSILCHANMQVVTNQDVFCVTPTCRWSHTKKYSVSRSHAGGHTPRSILRHAHMQVVTH